MQRRGSAEWSGDLKSGKGKVSSESGVLNQASYSFTTRFENRVGTNPEELVAAAHAACFSMALSNELSTASYKPENVKTSAVANFEKKDDAWTITEIHLDTRATVPGIEPAAFQDIARKAKENCPISRLFNTRISMEARLE